MTALARGLGFKIAATLCAGAVVALSGATPSEAGVFGRKAAKAPAYTAPAVALPKRVIQAAAAYEAYVASAASISPPFVDGPGVSAAVRQGAGYEAEQMQRGEAAYAAIAALQDPTFVAAVRAYTVDAATRQAIASQIMKDPTYVLGISGASSAAAKAAYALDAQGTLVRAAGERVKASAYEVQKQAWSKAPVADRLGRMAEAKTLSITPRSGSPEAVSRLQLAASGGPPMSLAPPSMAPDVVPPSGLKPAVVTPRTLTPSSIGAAMSPIPSTLSPPYTPLVVRALAAAALAVLGEGTEVNSDYIWGMLNEPNQGLCFNMAKLNLYQCLSVAKPYYEDVFCLGQHILIDTGQCIVRGAGVQTISPIVFAQRPNAVAYGAKPDPKKAAPKKTAAKKK